LDVDGAERFGGRLLDFFHEACAHAEESGEEGGASGVKADATQGESRPWKASGEDDPKAAEEKSPGTSSSVPSRRWGPWRMMEFFSRRRLAPKAGRRRSV